MNYKEEEMTEEEVQTFWIGPNSQRNYFVENSLAFIAATAIIGGFLYVFVLFSRLI